MIKFENPTNGRFYYLQRNRDMFGDIVLTVFRGGHRTRIVRHYGYGSESDFSMAVSRLTKIRLRHGYVQVN